MMRIILAVGISLLFCAHQVESQYLDTTHYDDEDSLYGSGDGTDLIDRNLQYHGNRNHQSSTSNRDYNYDRYGHDYNTNTFDEETFDDEDYYDGDYSGDYNEDYNYDYDTPAGSSFSSSSSSNSTSSSTTTPKPTTTERITTTTLPTTTSSLPTTTTTTPLPTTTTTTPLPTTTTTPLPTTTTTPVPTTTTTIVPPPPPSTTTTTTTTEAPKSIMEESGLKPAEDDGDYYDYDDDYEYPGEDFYSGDYDSDDEDIVHHPNTPVYSDGGRNTGFEDYSPPHHENHDDFFSFDRDEHITHHDQTPTHREPEHPTHYQPEEDREDTATPPPSGGMDTVGGMQIYSKEDDRQVSIFAQPGILAAFIGGAVVGLLCAILLVMFVVYRMRKKDEGSYPLDEPKRVPLTSSYATTDKEIYA